MSKFIVIGEVIDEHRTWDIHLNVDSVNYLEVAKSTIASTVITLCGAGKSDGRDGLYVKEDVSTVAKMLKVPFAVLPNLSGMGRHSADVWVLTSQVRLVTEQRPRAGEDPKKKNAKIEFNDGSKLEVDDASALIAIL